MKPRSYLIVVFCFLGSFFLSIICPLTVSAQQQDTLYWPTDTAWWCVEEWRYDPDTGEPGFNYRYYKMYGDTLANGHEWQKVHHSRHLAFDSPYNRLHCLTRLEDKRVHIKYMPTSGYADTNEYVLYDFNLNIGDTFQFHLLNWQTDSVFEFKLGGKSYTTLLTGYVRITFGFHWLDHSTSMWGTQCDPNFFLSWQSIHGAINPSPFWMEYREGFCIDSLGALKCVHLNNGFVWGGGIQCDSSSIGIAEKQRTAWPTVLTMHGGEVRVPDLGSGQARYTLYSVLGQQLMEGNLTGDALQLPYLPPGIYVLRLSGTHRQIVFKLINP
jgi:hypothetical protein